MSEEYVKCPICGTQNDAGNESCVMCKTRLSKDEEGTLKVESPKHDGNIYNMIDIEDPKTRKRLEELTLIPGVTRRKALYLYQSGIHSMDDFLKKAFVGEKYADNFSRAVANKLLLRSLKGQKQQKKEILCPGCDAPNPVDADKCKVCNHDIAEEMASIDIDNISSDISESITDIIGELSENEDFDALPEEMKKQFAWAIESDQEIGGDIEESIEKLGIDLDSIEEEAVEPAEEAADAEVEPEPTEPIEGSPEDIEEPEPEEATEIEEPPVEEVAKEEPEPEEKEPVEEPKAEPEKELTAKQKRVRKILGKKVNQWRKAGYDVEGLDEYYDDVEGFKARAKKCLEKGKVIRDKCEKQMVMWRDKGFDVSELEALLNTDIDEFKERAKEILKEQQN